MKPFVAVDFAVVMTAPDKLAVQFAVEYIVAAAIGFEVAIAAALAVKSAAIGFA